jgi:hypothetical protein
VTPTVAAQGEATGVERVFREVYGQAVATLIRIFGDITLVSRERGSLTGFAVRE